MVEDGVLAGVDQNALEERSSEDPEDALSAADHVDFPFVLGGSAVMAHAYAIAGLDGCE
jgi:hypothetical protein